MKAIFTDKAELLGFVVSKEKEVWTFISSWSPLSNRSPKKVLKQQDLILRIGFGAQYTIITTRNPPKKYW